MDIGDTNTVAGVHRHHWKKRIPLSNKFWKLNQTSFSLVGLTAAMVGERAHCNSRKGRFRQG